jgi:hypothetical protein
MFSGESVRTPLLITGSAVRARPGEPMKIITWEATRKVTIRLPLHSEGKPFLGIVWGTNNCEKAERSAAYQAVAHRIKAPRGPARKQP